MGPGAQAPVANASGGYGCAPASRRSDTGCGGRSRGLSARGDPSLDPCVPCALCAPATDCSVLFSVSLFLSFFGSSLSHSQNVFVMSRFAPIESGQWVREVARAFGQEWADATYGALAGTATVLCSVNAYRVAPDVAYLLSDGDEGAWDLKMTGHNCRCRRVSTKAPLLRVGAASPGSMLPPPAVPPAPSSPAVSATYRNDLLCAFQAGLRKSQVGVCCLCGFFFAFLHFVL